MSNNIGIEVTHYRTSFELRCNKDYVMSLPWGIFDRHKTMTGNYGGKSVEMKGQFVPAQGFIIDVFIDNEHAAKFLF